MTINQPKFIGERSVISNISDFLQDIHIASNNKLEESVLTIYADFSRPFGRVLHELFLQKLVKIQADGVLNIFSSTT